MPCSLVAYSLVVVAVNTVNVNGCDLHEAPVTLEMIFSNSIVSTMLQDYMWSSGIVPL